MQTGNLNGQGIAELQNYKFQNLQTAPTTNIGEGRFYYSTADHTLYIWNGTNWANALTQGTTYTDGTGIIINGNQIAVDFTDVATAAQGTKADTALQSGDNISELNNNVGYITNSALSGYVPTSRKINGKALTADITLSASDVSALPSSTTINDLTTTAQQNALNSGATTAKINQIATNTSAISTINGKIPSQASTTNQLADKDFVNSSISTNTAYFDGSWATYAAIPISASDFTSAGYPEPTNNNYLVVVEDETQDGGTWRYKYVDGGGAYAKANWKVEYEVNETPLTAAQIAALNSGATTTNIGQISTNTSDIADLRTNKQNTITDLATIRSNASNGQSAYTTIQGYGDIVTHNMSEFATVAQVYTTTNPALTQSGGVAIWPVTHNIGANVTVQVYEVSTGAMVIPNNITLTSSTVATIELLTTANVTASKYKVVVTGVA
jgi:hypothetical protein